MPSTGILFHEESCSMPSSMANFGTLQRNKEETWSDWFPVICTSSSCSANSVQAFVKGGGWGGASERGLQLNQPTDTEASSLAGSLCSIGPSAVHLFPVSLHLFKVCWTQNFNCTNANLKAVNLQWAMQVYPWEHKSKISFSAARKSSLNERQRPICLVFPKEK